VLTEKFAFTLLARNQKDRLQHTRIKLDVLRVCPKRPHPLLFNEE